ncbi:hypothetical protein HZB01_00520 [Candidatus Woesearchaeota archaeon]|nr:hypothetical protein [Candidatus Woesearchaeota archaeon]
MRIKKGINTGLFLVLLLAFAILAGCVPGTGPGTGTDSPASTGPSGINVVYQTGTQGLVMNFVENYPPQEIFDTDIMNLVIKLENKGTFPLNGGSSAAPLAGTAHIQLAGYDPSILVATRTMNVFPDLDGKSLYNPEGDFTTIDYTFDVDLPPNVEIYSPTLQATACYEYLTKATPTICIDPSLYTATTIRDKVCKVEDKMLSGGQGAPIGITKIEVNMLGRDDMRAQLKIHVKNEGGGKVYRAEKVGDCPDLLYDIDDYDRVELVTLSTSDGRSLLDTCKPLEDGRYIRLYNGEGFVICKYTDIKRDTPAFETPINVEIRYGYTTSVSRKVTIKNTPE